MLNPFKFTWWQLAIYETSLIALGLLVGSHFPEIFTPLRLILIVIFVVPALYIWKIAFGQFKQMKEN